MMTVLLIWTTFLITSWQDTRTCPADLDLNAHPALDLRFEELPEFIISQEIISVREVKDGSVRCTLPVDMTIVTGRMGKLVVRADWLFEVSLDEEGRLYPSVQSSMIFEVPDLPDQSPQDVVETLSEHVRGVFQTAAGDYVVQFQALRPVPDSRRSTAGMQVVVGLDDDTMLLFGVPGGNDGFKEGTTRKVRAKNGHVAITLPAAVVEEIAREFFDWKPDEAPARPLPGPPMHDEVEPIVLPGDPDEETIIEDLFGDDNP